MIFFRSSTYPHSLKLLINNDQAFYMGINTTISKGDGNSPLSIEMSEQKNVFLGNDVMFSFGVWIRNSDPHLIYSTKDGKRINSSKSVFIGDHVWIGQNVLLLKGTHIASGSIIAANSVVAGKKISSNTVWAGNPARKTSEKVFWSRECVHNWTEIETEKFKKMETDKYTFHHDPKIYIPFDEIDKQLSSRNTADEKLDYLIKISNFTAKNRFTF